MTKNKATLRQQRDALADALRDVIAYDVKMYETTATPRLRVPPEIERARELLAMLNAV